MPSSSVTVLIVGAGPVGLLAAILLARQGIDCLVIERRRPRQDSAPKAHVVNPRSLEIFRSAGLDVDEMYAQGSPPDKWTCSTPTAAASEKTRFQVAVSSSEAGFSSSSGLEQ